MASENQVINKLKEIYGEAEGIRIYMTVMPGILADFRKMLDAAKPGSGISEEYILEDKKASLKLHGHKGKDDIVIEASAL